MRLIDADALIDNIPQADLNNDKKISKCGAIADMVLLVCDAPTIDAVPVVRCGECIKPLTECPFKEYVMLKTDYCSHGAKMEDKQ
jgi:hypothetical protein